jgi:hypothetical protein
LEVVEHLYYPKRFASTIQDVLVSGGGSHHFDAVSRLLEEFGACVNRKARCSLHRAVGSRAH